MSTPRTLDELIGRVETFFENKTDSQGMSLLEVACLGNAEKTLQGELFHYLRSHGWNVVLELGYLHARGVRRNPDIGVFDSFGSGKELISVIELKHYSSNQNAATYLTEALDHDYGLKRPAVPLIQIGFYTTVTEVMPPLSGPFENGIYRFLNTYCDGKLPPKHAGSDVFAAWGDGKNWLSKLIIGQTTSTTFVDNNDRRISGHIEYVVGMRQ